mgnify:CR=1 FL=1
MQNARGIGLLEWVLLGLLQGVVEWLPVSSTIVVMLAETAMGLSPSEAYNVALALHMGSLLALLASLGGDYTSMIKDLLGGRGRDFFLLLVVTFLTGIVGVPTYLLVYHLLKEAEWRTVALSASALLGLTALGTSLTKGGSKGLGIKEAILLGVAQGLAATPGLSRSGVTVAVLMSLSVSKDEAFRWSYLAAGPAILGATLLEVLTGQRFFNIPMLVSCLAAFLSGALSIKYILEAVKKVRREVLALIVSAGLIISALLL